MDAEEKLRFTGKAKMAASLKERESLDSRRIPPSPLRSLYLLKQEGKEKSAPFLLQC